jgi:hypothetical protein
MHIDEAVPLLEGTLHGFGEAFAGRLREFSNSSSASFDDEIDIVFCS